MTAPAQARWRDLALLWLVSTLIGLAAARLLGVW